VRTRIASFIPFALAAILVLASGSPASAQQAQKAPQNQQESCATNCHGAEATAASLSVHAGRVSCVECHGGDASAVRDKDASHAASAGFRGKPTRAQIPELCGNCHADPQRMFAYELPTDQLVHYRTSGHGKALFEKGDTNVAVCSDCHTAHAVSRVDDPSSPTHRSNLPATCGKCHADAALMDQYGLPANIVAEFEASVHGKALLVDRTRGAPSCIDCHSSHGIVPPGVAVIEQVCARCHENTGEYYRQSPHAGSPEMNCSSCHLDEPGFRRSECAACHGAHAIATPGPEMFQGTEPGHCAHCHREDDGAAAVSATILDGTKRLQAVMDETSRSLRLAKQQGLFVDNEQIHLQESQRVLVSVKPISHSLDVAVINAAFDDGVRRQDRTREIVQRQHVVLRDRRLLVGGVCFVLLMLVGLLVVKLGAVRKLS